jgi:hypothetical protein
VFISSNKTESGTLLIVLAQVSNFTPQMLNMNLVFCPLSICPSFKILVGVVKIPAAAGKAHEEPSKTVGPAGDSLYQSQREEKKLMVDNSFLHF